MSALLVQQPAVNINRWQVSSDDDDRSIGWAAVTGYPFFHFIYFYFFIFFKLFSIIMHRITSTMRPPIWDGLSPVYRFSGESCPLSSPLLGPFSAWPAPLQQTLASTSSYDRAPARGGIGAQTIRVGSMAPGGLGRDTGWDDGCINGWKRKQSVQL